MILIKNCFDSHLHWQGIGSFSHRLDLSEVKSRSQLSSLKILKKNFRGNWLLGHGFNLDFFKLQPAATLKALDTYFDQTPVYFTSPDIHSVWLNSAAIKKLNLNTTTWKKAYKPYILSDNQGQIFGLFFDKAKDYIDSKLPSFTDDQVQSHLLSAQKIIHQAGITHIRDLTCSEQQLKVARALERSGQLKLVAELFFKLQKFSDLDHLIRQVKSFQQTSTELLKVKGLKIFIDGALGSEGALLSKNYLNGNQGFSLFSQIEIEHILRQAFTNNLEVAFHVIGDKASDIVCQVALGLKKQGIQGVLHFEHVQILANHTIKDIQQLGAICHMQPQHWYSDRHWLQKKNTPRAYGSNFSLGRFVRPKYYLLFWKRRPRGRYECWAFIVLFAAIRKQRNKSHLQ